MTKNDEKVLYYLGMRVIYKKENHILELRIQFKPKKASLS